MSKFWSGFVSKLDPYVPGEQPKNTDFIKLNTNENPYPPAPGVFQAIHDAANASLRLYPDPDSRKLKEAIAAYYQDFQITPEQISVGNSSDEVLAHVFHALFKQPEPLLFPDITYGFYPTYTLLFGIDFVKIPLTDDFRIRIDDYFRPNGGIIFPNPNAPTGALLSLAEIERLAQKNTDSAIVIDEAYVDFGGQSAVSLINRYPNLLVVQTVSKSRSLAGLRVGLAIGHAELIEGIERIKNSFNSYPLDRLATAGAVAAFEDRAYFDETCAAIVTSREKLSAALVKLGFDVLSSAANFIFVRHPGHDAAQLAAALRQRNILVRHFRQPRIEQFLRISIGNPEECEAVADALRQIIG